MVKLNHFEYLKSVFQARQDHIAGKMATLAAVHASEAKASPRAKSTVVLPPAGRQVVIGAKLDALTKVVDHSK